MHSLLDYYDKIPGSEFAGFGGKNRRLLLKRKGAILDTSIGIKLKILERGNRSE